MMFEEAMAKRGYTKEELADAIGVVHTAPNNWLRGRNAPNYENRKLIERVLGCGPIEYPVPSRERRAQTVKRLPVVDETGITPDPEPEQMQLLPELPESNRHQ